MSCAIDCRERVLGCLYHLGSVEKLLAVCVEKELCDTIIVIVRGEHTIGTNTVEWCDVSECVCAARVPVAVLWQQRRLEQHVAVSS